VQDWFITSQHKQPFLLALHLSTRGHPQLELKAMRCSWWHKSRACASRATQQATFIHGVVWAITAVLRL
jgi:hypothetical protein